ncbi:hypothetical protein ATR1_240d0001, partial [Acetobacter tropicalis]
MKGFPVPWQEFMEARIWQIVDTGEDICEPC